MLVQPRQRIHHQVPELEERRGRVARTDARHGVVGCGAVKNKHALSVVNKDKI